MVTVTTFSIIIEMTETTIQEMDVVLFVFQKLDTLVLMELMINLMYALRSEETDSTLVGMNVMSET